jgi:hypothetical protein
VLRTCVVYALWVQKVFYLKNPCILSVVCPLTNAIQIRI